MAFYFHILTMMQVKITSKKIVNLHKILGGKKEVKRPRVKPKNRHGNNTALILKKKKFDKVSVMT